MGLATIIDAVSAVLPFRAETLIGEENLSAAGAPPRIVWVPSNDSFSPASERGRPEQRSLATRRVGVDVHLWGADLAAAEAMIDGFVWALRQVVGANYELLGGSWKGQSVTAKGRAYILGIAMHVPVVEPKLDHVTITAVPQDVAFVWPQ